jgi:hypothetical protein
LQRPRVTADATQRLVAKLLAAKTPSFPQRIAARATQAPIPVVTFHYAERREVKLIYPSIRFCGGGADDVCKRGGQLGITG